MFTSQRLYEFVCKQLKVAKSGLERWTRSSQLFNIGNSLNFESFHLFSHSFRHLFTVQLTSAFIGLHWTFVLSPQSIQHFGSFNSHRFNIRAQLHSKVCNIIKAGCISFSPRQELHAVASPQKFATFTLLFCQVVESLPTALADESFEDESVVCL